MIIFANPPSPTATWNSLRIALLFLQSCEQVVRCGGPRRAVFSATFVLSALLTLSSHPSRSVLLERGEGQLQIMSAVNKDIYVDHQAAEGRYARIRPGETESCEIEQIIEGTSTRKEIYQALACFPPLHQSWQGHWL